MKKFSTIKLLGILAVLLIIYAATEFFGGTGRSRSFKEELVSIDTAAVTSIEIKKGDENLVINKDQDGWKISSNGGTEYKAEDSRVKNSLSSLQSIKPSRIASRNPEKWKEFQVDSAGTRVIVNEGNKKSLDIVLGRFGMQNQQQFYSYVRLFDDDNVYVADNFMGFSVPTDEESYRNQKLTTFSKDSVNTIRFVYPGDSSFSMEKSISGNWVSSDFVPDSAKTAQFISSLTRLSSNKFENSTSISGLAPTFQALIETSGDEVVELNAVNKTDSTYIITSSQNLEGKFEDPSLFQKIFKPKSSFYSDAPLVSEE